MSSSDFSVGLGFDSSWCDKLTSSNWVNMAAHLLNRNCCFQFYDHLYTDGEVVDFQLFSVEGKHTGFLRYNPDPKAGKKPHFELQRYKPVVSHGEVGFWGLETMDLVRNNSIVFVEGIFKAAALHKIGYNAIAVLGSDPRRVMNEFEHIKCDKFAIGDNDDAGRKFNKWAAKCGATPLVVERDLDEYNSLELMEVLSCLIKKRKVLSS